MHEKTILIFFKILYLRAAIYNFSLKNIITSIPAVSTQSHRLSVDTSVIAASNVRVVQFHPNYIHIGRINFVRSNGVPEYAGIYLTRYVTESWMIDGSNVRTLCA